MSSSESAAAASRLCRACGLCCNGMLFHIVRLQPSDSAKQLEALGMKLSRKKREPYFKQPCSFLNDCTCTQYAARPIRCRLFECRQLQRLADLEVTEDEVRRTIDDVKGRETKVKMLLLEAGNTATDLPLSERCARVLAAVGDSEMTSVQRNLAAEMTSLNEMLNEKFRLEPQCFDPQLTP